MAKKQKSFADKASGRGADADAVMVKYVKSVKSLKSIDCPSDLNSSAIDEFLIIFLIAAKANGVSIFKKLSELNQKESPRLKWGSKILNMMVNSWID